MIQKLLAGGAVAAFAVMLTPAVAQQAPPPPPGVAQGTSAPPPAMTPHAHPVIRARQVEVRTRGDRVLTREDVVKHVREMFERLDTNHDGFITKDEVEAFDAKMAQGMEMGGRFRERFRRARFEGRRAKADMGPPDRAALFDKLDTNHDGVISRQEFMAARPEVREKRVVMMRDGGANMPTMGEMKEPGMHRMHRQEMGMHGGFGAHLFAMADANHDGRVSLQEAEAAALAHFDKADLNHDGKVTPEERWEAHERMRAEHHPG